MQSSFITANAATAAPLRLRGGLRGASALGGQQLVVLVLIVALAIGVQAYQPAFLTPRSVDNVLRMASMYGIAALGMTLVIVSGGIDLSVGSMIALGGALGAGLLGTAYGAANPIQMPAFAAILAAVAIASAVGALNGIAVAKFSIAPFVVTLGMMTVVRGLTFIFADFTVQGAPGAQITFSDDLFDWIGSGWIGPLPSSAAAFLILAAIIALVLRFTGLGRGIYAVGGDPEIARLAGINTGAVLIAVYCIAGGLAAVSGIVLAGRLSSVSPLIGTGYELNVITIVVVGGASLAGGRGTILGTVLATVLITMIDSGLDIMNVPSFYQYLVKGAVLLGAVLADQWYRDRHA